MPAAARASAVPGPTAATRTSPKARASWKQARKRSTALGDVKQTQS